MKKTFILSNRNIGTVIEEVDGFFQEETRIRQGHH